MRTILLAALVLFSMNSFALYKCETSNNEVFHIGHDESLGHFVRYEGQRMRRKVEFKFGMEQRHALTKNFKLSFARPTGLGTAKIDGDLIQVECVKTLDLNY